MSFGLAAPWVAWLGLAALAVALVASRGRVLGNPAAALRVLALALFALALAGPRLGLERPGLVVLTDVSDSAGPAPPEAARLPALRRLEFAGQAGPAGLERTALEPGATDLAGALQVAGASRPARILLLSDGNATTGDPVGALPGVPVDVLPLPGRENARVADLLVPGSAALGESVRATAVLESSRAAVATLRPSLNGRPLPTRRVSLPAGRTSLPVEFVVPGSGEYELTLAMGVDFEQPALDDRRAAYLRAKGAPPVLVIGDPAAARLLRAQGFAVREAGPEAVTEPFSPAAVVVRAPAGRFTGGQLALLARYVNEGGGLMLTGGPAAFGLGGWYRTPVEATLPVTSDLRTRVDVPLVAMVIVLDRSLSMAGSAGGNQKLALAVEGVAGVVELAHERDLVGLLTFSDTPRWVFRPLRASENNKLQMVRALETVQAEGGTVVLPAYREAIETLKSTRASIKHLILLTDGQFADEGPLGGNRPPDYAGLARSARAAGITTSSIAIGEDADVANLKLIAGAGGGRFYTALDAATLPRVFTTEALTATRGLVRGEPARPTLVRHPLAAGVVGRPPALTAYVATTLRSTAEPILIGLDREPVLAVARRGLGRTAALTADLNRADPFTGWAELPALIGTVARWLQAPPQPYALSLSPDGRTATVDAVVNGAYLDGERLTVRVGGEALAMVQTAPGRYTAELPPNASGSVVLSRGGELLARARLERDERELQTTNGAETLRRVAAASGGRVLASLSGYEPASTFEATSLAGWVALAGALALVLELAWRRFRL